MKKYQYLVITTKNTTSDGIMTETIDVFGRNGWELISVIQLANNNLQFFFKMEIQ